MRLPRPAFAAALYALLSAPAAAQAPPLTASCIVQEISRRTVSVADDVELYVAPDLFVANAAGDVLLAGTPNYLFGRRSDGTEFLVKRDSVFGAVLKADGSVRVVPSPMDPQLLGAVSAAARDDGGWDVVFGQHSAPQGAGSRRAWDSLTHLWHGVYDGTEWRSLQELPRPPDVTLHAGGASPLARHGERLAWALGGQTPAYTQPSVVWERRDGRWSFEILPGAGGASRALGYADSSRLILALVSGDTAGPGPSHDVNSLFLWSRDPAWRQLRRVVLGGRDGATHRPLLAPWNGLLAMTWAADTEAGQQVHALLDVLHERSDPLVVDSSFSGWTQFSALGTADGRHLWLTRHDDPATGAPQLRFVIWGRGRSWGVANIPYPFLAPFEGVLVNGGDLLVTGPIDSPGGGTVQSLVLGFRMSCPAP
jgi:hypothetical protein